MPTMDSKRARRGKAIVAGVLAAAGGAVALSLALPGTASAMDVPPPDQCVMSTHTEIHDGYAYLYEYLPEMGLATNHYLVKVPQIPDGWIDIGAVTCQP